MTEEADTGTPAATADTAPPSNDGAGTQPTTGKTTPAAAEPTFTIPDEYKDRGFAAKIKTPEDLWKQLDNLDKLAGKKAIPTIDYSTATAEEIAAYHAKLAPQDRKAYEFPNADDPVAGIIGDAFIAAGINEHQGKAIIQKLAPVLEKMDEESKAASMSEEGYMKLSKEAFGENFKDAITKVEVALKTHAPDDASKKVFDDMTNDQRIAVDKTLNAILAAHDARVQKLLKDHGITETGAQAEGGKGTVAGNVADVRRELRQKIREMDSRPHTAQEKKILIDKLNQTYKQ